MALSAGQIKGAAQAAGFSGGNLTVAVAVALAESGGNPNATNHNTNGSTDYGLWQINSIHPTILAMGNWRDPNTNAKMAFAISKGSNWQPWSTYNSGAYKRHLAEAQNATGVPAPGADGGGGGDGVAGAITGFGASVDKFVQFVTDPKMWLRMAIFSAGSTFAIIGLVLVLKDTAAGQAAISVGKKAAGAAAKVALL